LKSNQPPNTTPSVNDTTNRDISTNRPPPTPPVASLSSDSESSHHQVLPYYLKLSSISYIHLQAKKTTDPTDLEFARTDHHSSTHTPSSSTNLSDLSIQTGPSPSTDTPGAPLSSRPTLPMSVETFANSSPTEWPSQVATTTANAPLSSASTTSVDRSDPSQSGPTNPAPVQTPIVLTSTSLNNVSLPSKSLADIVRDATVMIRMTERPSPPTPTTTSAHSSSAHPPFSASIVPTGCRNANSQSRLPQNTVCTSFFLIGLCI